MKFRKLRIAWSVFWGLVCVLLIALWVRSYYEGDTIERWHERTRVLVSSVQGQLVALAADYSVTVPATFTGMRFHKWNVTKSSPFDRYVETSLHMPSLLGFRFGRVPATPQAHTFVLISVPHWFPAFIGVALGASPLLLRHSRFSLRTLLIATTLVGVVLGLAVYFASK